MSLKSLGASLARFFKEEGALDVLSSQEGIASEFLQFRHDHFHESHSARAKFPKVVGLLKHVCGILRCITCCSVHVRDVCHLLEGVRHTHDDDIF